MFEQPNQEQSKNHELIEGDFEKLLDLVKEQYEKRGAKNIQSFEDHNRQVLDNAVFIGSKLQEEGEEFDMEKVKVMAALHDIAKIDEDGKIDIFHHHDSEKVEEASKEAVEFLKEKGFVDEEISFILKGIGRHSYATKFIVDELKRQGEEIPNTKDDPIEFKILYDADIMNQAELRGGFKKIMFSRIVFMHDWDRNVSGSYDIEKSIESVRQSAEDALSNMSLDVSRENAKKKYEEILLFIEEFKKEHLGEFKKMCKKAKDIENERGDAKSKYEEISVKFNEIIDNF